MWSLLTKGTESTAAKKERIFEKLKENFVPLLTTFLVTKGGGKKKASNTKGVLDKQDKTMKKQNEREKGLLYSLYGRLSSYRAFTQLKSLFSLKGKKQGKHKTKQNDF